MSGLRDARIQYLDKASRRLFHSSPTVSAHLQIARKAIAGDNHERNSDSTSSDTCAHCGNILISGWSCILQPKPGPKRSRKDRLSQPKYVAKAVNLECTLCGKVTKIKRPKGREDHRVENRRLINAPTTSTEPTSNYTSSNDVKQVARKRTRSKKLSLQSMLEKKTEASQTNKGFGLEFSDFMKS